MVRPSREAQKMTQNQRPVGVSEASAKDAYRLRTRSASDACADYLRSQIVSGEIEELMELRVATETLALEKAVKKAAPGDFMSADFEFQE